MDRPQLPEAQLREASNHLHHEIRTLKSLANSIACGEIKDDLLNLALLDSFAMHARTLLDFIYAKDPRLDEVIAEDFIPASKWKSERPARSVLLQKFHERARKNAYLAYDRPQNNSEAAEWRFQQITDEIVDAFKRFLFIVPENFLGSKWISGLNKKEPDVQKK